MESYVEQPPLPGLAGVVRTVWIQRTGAVAYVQRHLPTGGVEIHFPIGGRPQLVGPLTGPEVEVIPAHTTIVGVRFLPGTAPPLPAVLDDLVDQRLGLADLWGRSVDRLVDAMAEAGTPAHALMFLQAHLLREFRGTVGVDPLVDEAVRALMPWHPVNIDTLATHLALSASQLRRRCLHAVGVSPKVLQRTLRFQGFSRAGPGRRHRHGPARRGRRCGARGRRGVRRPGPPQPGMPSPDRRHASAAPRRRHRPVRLRPRALRLLRALPSEAQHAAAARIEGARFVQERSSPRP